MKNIKIIRGAYGHRPEGSRLTVTKTPTDPPFSVNDAEAARLSKMGVAAIDNGQLTMDNQDAGSRRGDSQSPETPPGGTTAGTAGDAPYSVDMTAAELKEAMKAAGLTVKARMSKAEMVAALTAATAVNSEQITDNSQTGEDGGEDDEDDEPDLDGGDDIVT